MKSQILKNVIPKTFPYGVALAPEQEQFIEKQIEAISEKAPSNAAITLHFEKRKSCFKGTLKIDNLSQSFCSSKAAIEPIQTFLLLQEDIEHQLLNWKRQRFSDDLYKQLSKATSPQKEITS